MDRTLYDWAGDAAAALELPAETRWVADRETVQAVLELARDVAQGVARPGAPVGAFLAGVAVGLEGAGDSQSLDRVRERLKPTLSVEPS